MMRPPPSSPLFPYPTLFRSCSRLGLDGIWLGQQADDLTPYDEQGVLRHARLLLSMVRDQLRLAGLEQELDSLRSEEHTSELQSPCNLVCRLLLEKKKEPHLAPSLFRAVILHVPRGLSPLPGLPTPDVHPLRVLHTHVS